MAHAAASERRDEPVRPDRLAGQRSLAEERRRVTLEEAGAVESLSICKPAVELRGERRLLDA